MAEFKVKNDLKNEISAVEKAEEVINEKYSDISNRDVSTLRTANTYIAQSKEIKSLLDLYKELVKKDVNDLYKMFNEVKAMDEKISGSSGGGFRSGGGSGGSHKNGGKTSGGSDGGGFRVGTGFNSPFGAGSGGGGFRSSSPRGSGGGGSRSW